MKVAIPLVVRGMSLCVIVLLVRGIWDDPPAQAANESDAVPAIAKSNEYLKITFFITVNALKRISSSGYTKRRAVRAEFQQNVRRGTFPFRK